MEGETRRCPWCAETIDAAAASCPFCDQAPGAGGPAASPATRRCTWCLETIDAAATICPLCKGSAAGPAAEGPVSATIARPPSGTAALVWGIIGLAGGLFMCFPLLFGPIAWWLGSKYERECREQNVEPESSGRTGKILGIITTALLGIWTLCVAGFIAFFAVTLSRSAP